jgi:hypothetical protein
LKKKAKPKDVCANEAECFLPFTNLVFKLEFTEEPDYGKLKHSILGALLSKSKVPDNRFQWSKFKKNQHEQKRSTKVSDCPLNVAE